MKDDIVIRLRALRGKCQTAPAMAVWSRDLREAADEIELLRSTVTDCRIEIERLTAERDEARREVCVWQGLDTATKSNEVARVRGWDCFKEDGK